MEISRKIISKQWGIFALFYFLVSIISVSGILIFGIGILYTLPVGACILYASFEDILDFYVKNEEEEDDMTLTMIMIMMFTRIGGMEHKGVRNETTK